jgi:hypothetical protein
MPAMKTALIAAVLLAACGGTQKCPDVASAPAGGPGQIDSKIAEAIATYAGAEKLEIYTDASGKIVKLSVYHHDAAKVPDLVKKVAGEQFPGATVKSYEFELYAGEGYVHEVEFETADKKECEVSVSAEGKVRYTECVIDKAPDAIAAKVKELVPDGTIAEVEEKKGPGIDEISIEVKTGAIEHYLRFKRSGELVARSKRVVARIDVAAK